MLCITSRTNEQRHASVNMYTVCYDFFVCSILLCYSKYIFIHACTPFQEYV